MSKYIQANSCPRCGKDPLMVKNVGGYQIVCRDRVGCGTKAQPAEYPANAIRVWNMMKPEMPSVMDDDHITIPWIQRRSTLLKDQVAIVRMEKLVDLLLTVQAQNSMRPEGIPKVTVEIKIGDTVGSYNVSGIRIILKDELVIED